MIKELAALTPRFKVGDKIRLKGEPEKYVVLEVKINPASKYFGPAHIVYLVRHPDGGKTNIFQDEAVKASMADADIDEFQENEESKAPKGWEGTVKKMKKHPEIENPWKLAWYMKNKGYKSHNSVAGFLAANEEYKKEEAATRNQLQQRLADWLSTRINAAHDPLLTEMFKKFEKENGPNGTYNFANSLVYTKKGRELLLKQPTLPKELQTYLSRSSWFGASVEKAAAWDDYGFIGEMVNKLGKINGGINAVRNRTSSKAAQRNIYEAIKHINEADKCLRAALDDMSIGPKIKVR